LKPGPTENETGAEALDHNDRYDSTGVYGTDGVLDEVKGRKSTQFYYNTHK